MIRRAASVALRATLYVYVCALILCSHFYVNASHDMHLHGSVPSLKHKSACLVEIVPSTKYHTSYMHTYVWCRHVCTASPPRKYPRRRTMVTKKLELTRIMSRATVGCTAPAVLIYTKPRMQKEHCWYHSIAALLCLMFLCDRA